MCPGELHSESLTIESRTQHGLLTACVPRKVWQYGFSQSVHACGLAYNSLTGALSSVADSVLLVNIHAYELVSWLAETLQIAVANARPSDVPWPRIIDTKALNSVHNLSWVVFENYIVASDR
jgi:hypothetical protein